MPSGPLDEASAVDLADFLLAAAARRGATALVVEPKGGVHAVSLLPWASASTLPIPSRLGDALAVRLAIVAGIDPWGVEERLGLLRVRAGSAEDEYLVVLRRSPQGFGAEVRRIPERSNPADTATVAPPASLSRIGPYRLTGELGRGGMGVVYRAEREGLAKPVAVKVLRPELAGDPGIAARFVGEGRAASLANDPAIVNVIDFGSLPDGRAFLVMELVPGRTLDAALAAGPFEAQRALRIARRIAGALEVAHVRGVVHRDLKPSNVFLDELDNVKIGDFGAAQLMGPRAPAAEARSEIVIGTPFYMAPEQALGHPTDESTDVYALGCVLFRMLTGRVPYEGDTLREVLAGHVSAPLPPVRSPFGPLPGIAEEIVTKALAKRAEDRYRSAGEMAAELDRALNLGRALRPTGASEQGPS